MSVGKVFKVLIIVVACVILGALVLNILLPNVATSLVDSTEDMIYKATSMSFDFNGNGNAGGTNTGNAYNADITNGGNATDVTGGVEGFN